jgi:hypothetical protein
MVLLPGRLILLPPEATAPSRPPQQKLRHNHNMCSDLPVDGCYGFSGPTGNWTASRNPFPALNFGVLRAGITMS